VAFGNAFGPPQQEIVEPLSVVGSRNDQALHLENGLAGDLLRRSRKTPGDLCFALYHHVAYTMDCCAGLQPIVTMTTWLSRFNQF
jgi:hypothetical protein